jgi:hypothetical protein
MKHHTAWRALLCLTLFWSSAASAPTEAQQRVRPRSVASIPVRPTYPAGATLWWYAGDIQTGMDFAAKGGSQTFSWSVEAVPNANGVLWQVSRRPFPPFSGVGSATLDPPGLVKSGRSPGRKGEFTVSFAGLPKLPALKGANYPWYVWVIPTGGRAHAVAGQPSNTVRVYDQKLPPVKSDPNFSLGIKSLTEPGAKIQLTRFEFVPYRVDHRWPAGCEVFKGGNQQNPWEWLSGAALDLFDWASEAYSDMKGFVVQGVVTFLPFVPPEVAAIALDAALAAAGIPPSIPNLDQLMTQGADYLANQMADQLAAQVPAGNLAVAAGTEAARQYARDKARDALVANAKKARDQLAKNTKYCISRTYDPFFKITLRNVGPDTVRNLGVGVKPSAPLFRPGLGFRIDQLNPGESITVPVEFLSKWDRNAVPQNPKSQIDEKTSGNWWALYHKTPMTFTFSGGHTIYYSAMEKGESPISGPYVIKDGTGFRFTSPKRVWFDQPYGTIGGLIGGAQ